MMKLIPLTALALSLSSGVALADHRGGDHHSGAVEHRPAPVNRGPVEHGGWGGHGGSNVVVRGGGWGHGGGNVVVRGGGWAGHGGSNVVVRGGGGRDWHGGGRVYAREPYYRGGFRRPIYVNRPIIRERYYDYYRRPTLVAENYGAMSGYYWVAGQWSWNGYEWIWQPGHYQPDPNYVDQGYVDQGYADPAYGY